MELIPRAYQLAIYNSILRNGNTLVVLPTGLGKTLIGLLLIKEKLLQGPCLFLTPTKPLAKQHAETINSSLKLDVCLVSGEISPEKRRELYNKNNLIVSTPQTINNDLEKGNVESNFSLIIFDECHRAVGNYAYTKIAEKFNSTKTLFVGLTASPGGKKERIEEVMKALKITNIEIRSLTDPDVAPYVQKSEISWVFVELGEQLSQIKKELDGLISKHAQKLGAMGFPPPLKHKGQFLKLRERILNIPSEIKYPALIQYSILLHLIHMSELLETQGIYPLKDYIEKLKEKTSKSAAILLHDPILAKIVQLSSKSEDHPKMNALLNTLKELNGKKSIVFVQYRSQISHIEEFLKQNGFLAKQFVGKRDGVTRKIQEETIAEFRQGKFDVLVASSIAEEGLDIPAVDSVIFYEPIPSEIRSIQRRGRAARLKEGKVIVLITKGTRDEFYYYASRNREKKMKSILNAMKKEGSFIPATKINQTKIGDY